MTDYRILTCVYCGHEYPQATPAHGSSVLTEHIMVCDKHPMRKVVQDNTALREALVGLVGVDGRQSLECMKVTISYLPDSADRKVSIAAIDALLATLPLKETT